MITYSLIYTNRRSVALIVKPDGSLIVRAPFGYPKELADAFVREKADWIERAKKKTAEKKPAGSCIPNGSMPSAPAFTAKELAEFKKLAKQKLLPMVSELASLIGVTYGNVSVRAQKTRWGSCSAKGNLNFNCLLALLPENLQRYVVVHELCHRLQMNHSEAFWREVAKYQPTYKEDKKQLREQERSLLERLS